MKRSGRRPEVLRKLEGITYWVLQNPEEIGALINSNVRKEWESDIADQGEDHEHGKWLGTLSKRGWELKVVAVKDIKLGSAIMGYVNPRTGFSFRERLEERKAVLEREIDRFGAVLRPLIIRAEDNQLMDGYCRYRVFKDRGIRRAYAYLGTL